MSGNREAAAVQSTKSFCMTRYKSTTSASEKMAMVHYLSDLSKITTVEDSQSFRKPLIGAGGYGDQQITKNIVVRSKEDNSPVLVDGKLKLEEYRFDNLDTYLRSIECLKNPDYLDGVQKTHPNKDELRAKEIAKLDFLLSFPYEAYD